VNDKKEGYGEFYWPGLGINIQFKIFQKIKYIKAIGWMVSSMVKVSYFIKV